MRRTLLHLDCQWILAHRRKSELIALMTIYDVNEIFNIDVFLCIKYALLSYIFNKARPNQFHMIE